MGKIKTKLIKRTAKALMNSKEIEFSENFEKNKKIISNEMPSKKIKNQVAGYIARVKKREREKEEKIQESIKASKE